MKDNGRFAYVIPKERTSAQGRRRVINARGQQIIATKAPGTSTTFALSKKNGVLNTGLEYEVPNPYKGKHISDRPHIEKAERITRREELEIKYSLPKDYLTCIPGKSKKEYTYLQTFNKMLFDQENRIDLETLEGEVFLEAARVSHLIGNNRDDAYNNPYAMFYISEVNEGEERKAAKNMNTMEAQAKLYDLTQNFASSTSYKFVVHLGLGSGELSPEAITNKLSEFITGEKKSNNRNKFLDVYSMWKKDKKKFETIFFLRELVNYGVLSESRGAVYWSAKSGTSLEHLGNSQEAVVLWLQEKANEIYVTELKSALKAKKND